MIITSFSGFGERLALLLGEIPPFEALKRRNVCLTRFSSRSARILPSLPENVYLRVTCRRSIIQRIYEWHGAYAGWEGTTHPKISSAPRASSSHDSHSDA